jgi:hypothetical protein
MASTCPVARSATSCGRRNASLFGIEWVVFGRRCHMTRRWSWLVSAVLVGAIAPKTSALADERENETKVALENIPTAARDALLREAGGTPILAVFQETEHGHTIYEANVLKENGVIGIEVDATGKVLGTEVENMQPEHK